MHDACNTGGSPKVPQIWTHIPPNYIDHIDDIYRDIFCISSPPDMEPLVQYQRLRYALNLLDMSDIRVPLSVPMIRRCMLKTCLQQLQLTLPASFQEGVLWVCLSLAPPIHDSIAPHHSPTLGTVNRILYRTCIWHISSIYHMICLKKINIRRYVCSDTNPTIETKSARNMVDTHLIADTSKDSYRFISVHVVTHRSADHIDPTAYISCPYHAK